MVRIAVVGLIVMRVLGRAALVDEPPIPAFLIDDARLSSLPRSRASRKTAPRGPPQSAALATNLLLARTRMSAAVASYTERLEASDGLPCRHAGASTIRREAAARVLGTR